MLALGVPVALAAARSHLLDFAIGDPAPKTERIQLDRMLPPAYGPTEGPRAWRTRKDIIAGSERLVGQITTSSGSVARMYAVSLRGGGACWFATGAPFNGGGCGGASIHADGLALGGWVEWLHGRVLVADLDARDRGSCPAGGVDVPVGPAAIRPPTASPLLSLRRTTQPVGKRPSYLIGRTKTGRVVYRRFLYPRARCAYPGPDPRCSNTIVHNG